MQQELQKSIFFVSHYFSQIVDSKRLAFGLPLSVELRRLYSDRNKGNNLFRRVETLLNISLKFKVIKHLPDTFALVEIDNYMSRNVMFTNQRYYTRLDIIELVANQRGAHTDSKPDAFHSISAGVQLPWGNPAKTRLFLTQDLYYLVETAFDTLSVYEHQIKDKLTI